MNIIGSDSLINILSFIYGDIRSTYCCLLVSKKWKEVICANLQHMIKYGQLCYKYDHISENDRSIGVFSYLRCIALESLKTGKTSLIRIQIRTVLPERTNGKYSSKRYRVYLIDFKSGKAICHFNEDSVSENPQSRIDDTDLSFFYEEALNKEARYSISIWKGKEEETIGNPDINKLVGKHCNISVFQGNISSMKVTKDQNGYYLFRDAYARWNTTLYMKTLECNGQKKRNREERETIDIYHTPKRTYVPRISRDNAESINYQIVL